MIVRNIVIFYITIRYKGSIVYKELLRAAGSAVLIADDTAQVWQSVITDIPESIIINGGIHMRIDAGGKQCPIPVIMAKKELEAGAQGVEIIVDGQTQIDNLTRLGDSLGRPATSEPFEDKFLVKFANGETKKGAVVSCADSYAVFFNKDSIGTNESELGRNLAKMAIFTLSESDNIPSYVLFMNEGVKLVTGVEPQIIDNLNTLIEKGSQVLVCGTCLNFYGLKDEIKVGTVSNMYDILGAMQEVSKVIKL